MDFRKKLKVRLYVAIVYIILGLAMIVIPLFLKNDNNFASSLGFAFVAIGIARIRQYKLITKSEDSIKKREIAESDERSIFIASKARGIAFFSYIIVAALVIIVLQVLNYSQIALIISATVCFMVLVYWISYLIISKRS